MSKSSNRIPIRCGILSLFTTMTCCVLLAAGGIFFFIRSKQQPHPVTDGQKIPIRDDSTGTNSSVTSPGSNETQAISFRLSEGQAQPVAYEPLPLLDGEPLSPEEIDQILARLPALPTEPTDQTDFNLPADPIPPPRSGETVNEPFPPDESPATPPEDGEAGPLQVLRYAPEGEIPVAPFINITFNQPMVPLGTLQDLAAEDVPVQIEPPLSGTWRWLGTKTLNFQYDSELIDRLPKATEYLITVPAGTQSTVGGTLAEKVSWTFTTPAVKVVSNYPTDDSQPPETIFFVVFDQHIDPVAVLETIQVTADGERVSVRLAEEDEIQVDEQTSRRVEQALEGRWIAFRAVQPLPLDTGISVTIGPGTPSAEGPLLTTEAQSYSFRTYAPLRIDDHGCYWYDEICRPLAPFYIRFNNPIDTETYQESMLAIDPELPGAVANILGETIQIRGASQGQTTYRITISGEIQDIFGQKLGDDQTLAFDVGKAEPLLAGPEQIFVTLDPVAERPTFSVYTINYNHLNVKLYTVQPDDWPDFKTFLSERGRNDTPPSLPGRLVQETKLDTNAPDDTLTEVGIDLSKALDGAFGHVIVVVEPPVGIFNKDELEWQKIYAWVQVTQIGLDAFVDHSEMIAWATLLKDGTPLEGINIVAGERSTEATTDAEGIARFSIPSGASYLVARDGNDVALLPSSTYYWGETSWQTHKPVDELRWYVFDDRQMYKPGEEIHIKGWLRRIGGGQAGDVSLVGDSTIVSYRVTGPQGNELGDGQIEVSALGGFDLVFTLPEEVNLGYASFELTASGTLSGMYYHNFQIQEFRRPEFEVTARNETVGPYFAGGYAVVAVDANYYAGGPLPNADVTWGVSSSPSNYSPPNWPDFTFGEWTPWWWYYGDGYFEEGGGGYETFTGLTDAAGAHYLRLDFDEGGNARPISIQAEATVMDVNRQAWSSNTSLLVHPADLYVGLHSKRYFVERGDPMDIELIVTDVDGNAVADHPIEVSAARLEWKYRNSEWSEDEVDVQTCKVTSELEPVICTFETPVGGRYQIIAVIYDDLGRRNQSSFTRWVSGGQLKPSRNIEREEVTLIPDKETYQPGDVAQILVQSPFNPAEGLLTVSRSGMLYTERFMISDGSITLQIPIEENHIPNLNIQVDLVGSAERLSDDGEAMPDIPPRPAYASGSMSLNISTAQRTLALEITPGATELEPGAETTLALQISDANGNPVPEAELAVIVVDEANLALTNYQLSNPMSIFYSNRPADVSSHYSRSSIVLIDPLALETQNQAKGVDEPVYEMAADAVDEESEDWAMGDRAMAPEPTMASEADGAGAGEAAGAQTPINLRTDFNPLAAFLPTVYTDGNGQAQVNIKLPDNLTRYRVMVVAVSPDGHQFGLAETNITARLPLMVRPSAPRFLNYGDSFELPVVLQNQTDEPMTVDVAVNASNLNFTETAGKRVTVPARDRVEVRFPAATDMAGTTRIQIAAVSGDYADAAMVDLPVYTPATTEAFATYGVLDEDTVFQPVMAPSDVFAQYGGLEIDTSSTALQALSDAVLYLVSYPYECTEQLASRILAVAALRDVLSAFQAEGLPSPEEMEAAVIRDLERLQGIQNYDGGFPYWRRGFNSIPFNSIHATHAMARANQMGFTVPENMQQNALNYLREIENYYPSWYSQRTRWILSSYALYVRHLSGETDVSKAQSLLDEAGFEQLSLDAIGWLWQVLQDAPEASTQVNQIREYVNNHVVETAGAANFTTNYDEQNYLLLGSNRRTDAILLDAMIGDSPDSDLIPKVVNGLLAHQVRGRWNSTQENVFVLLAMDRYFDTYEAQTPDFVARVWLGETYAGEHEFHGYSTERSEIKIPMTYVVDPTLGGGGMQDLILSKDGTGRLYYRLGLRYAPTDLNMPPVDMGFVVERSYEAVDDPEDVSRDEDGVWHVKAGARVRIVLKMVADNRRYHVALVDPLPAGLEIVNPELAVSGSVPPNTDRDNPQPRYGWWWYWTWYEHENLRDERAEAFTSLLWDGVYEYTYIARATTPGTFVAPPAKAEEMYSPEVFGRSSSDWVIVE